ncbi:MAG: PKD domain-containing protein [Euryarchaeota archaeon]|nr:PKD domain-containing protein [Euryarchaeota archaeon]
MTPPVRLVVLVLLITGWSGCMGGGAGKSAPPSAEGLVASFSFSPELPAVNDPVQFRDESDGSPVAWNWAFGDGATSTEASPTHSFATEDVFTVRLTVTNAAGATDAAALFVTVGSVKGGGDPSAFRIDFTYDVMGQAVEFEPRVVPASAAVEDYFWEFGDGEVSKDSAPRHTYATDGLFEVKVRARSGTDLAEAKHVVPVGVDVKDPTALASRSFAIIAIVDSGINPYHEEFLAPEFTAHPSSYITGYPEDAIELSLSLAEQSYSEAVEADRDVWKSVKGNKLYWIPGTRVIGAVSVAQMETRILDDGVEDALGGRFGHGTAVASDAAGATIGACPQCLLVVVEGLGTAPLQWALNQPWIDVVSNSWGSCTLTCTPDSGFFHPLVTGPVANTRAAVEAGKEVFFAAGNGFVGAFDAPTLTYWNAYTGPDWIVTVGAAHDNSGATVIGTGRPVDITSYGLDTRGASYTSLTQFLEWSGTSAATPIAAGAYASIVQRAREALGDFEEGPRKGAVAEGAPLKGLLSDGKLTRAEAERALYLTAKGATGSGPVYVPPVVMLPHTAAAFLYAGYGLVDKKTAAEAFAVVAGDKAAPARSNEDTWASVDSQVRRAIWGSYSGGLADASQEDVRLWTQELGVELPTASS